MKTAPRLALAVLRALAICIATLASILCQACGQSEVLDTPSITGRQSALSVDQPSAMLPLPAGPAALRLVVKFKEGSDVRLREGRLVRAPRPTSSGAPNAPRAADPQALAADLEHVDTALRARRVALRRMFGSLSDEQLAGLKQRGEARSRRALADLGLYHQVPAAAFASRAQMEEVRAQLASLSIVEVAYIETEPAPAPDANTPDYRGEQQYRGPAPVGVDADYAATVPGGKGVGVRIVDVEDLLTQPHEELPALAYSRGEASADWVSQQHVVAVAGILVGRDDARGVTGVAPAAAFGSSGRFSGGSVNIAEAITSPIVSGFLREGDVILLEVQRTGPSNPTCRCGAAPCVGYLPEEVLPASFDAIATATANGITVVEPAGNGYINLDDPLYQRLFDRTVRDSGALMVGARYASAAQPICFSNTGTRVDLHAWGENVTTTGYGYSYQGVLGAADMYTRSFAGTSSASAITAGAVAALQGFARATFGVPLSPAEVRAVLTQTGSPQSGELESPIGVQPNLRAAIARLRDGEPAPAQTTIVADFERTIEPFTVATTGTQLPWTRAQGPTPTTYTGPDGDRTTGSGWYMYIESSDSGIGYPSKTAILESACLDLRGASAASWTFYYHMLGSNMGRLIAESDPGCDGGTMVPLFEQVGARTGSERNGYVRQVVDLSRHLGERVRLRLRGITGSGARSDIAVDDLSVSISRAAQCTGDAQCAAPAVCVGQRCVSCRADAECADGFCADGTCAECRFAADCADDGLFCTEEQCGPGNICSRRARSCGGLLCSDALSRCVQCRSNADCAAGSTCNGDYACVAAPPCDQFTSTTQQHVDAGRATTARVSARVEARVLGSTELLESRSLYGRFTTTPFTLRTRLSVFGYEMGGCPH
jgi:hypothetical protein